MGLMSFCFTHSEIDRTGTAVHARSVPEIARALVAGHELPLVTAYPVSVQQIRSQYKMTSVQDDVWVCAYEISAAPGLGSAPSIVLRCTPVRSTAR
eukprot:387787-Rhodomonas_salina.2